MLAEFPTTKVYRNSYDPKIRVYFKIILPQIVLYLAVGNVPVPVAGCWTIWTVEPNSSEDRKSSKRLSTIR